MNKSEMKASKYMSLVLRHKPQIANLTLDEHGWANIECLLVAMKVKGFNIDRAGLESIVENCDKKRYAISEDGTMIRAVQGHSVNVFPLLKVEDPPDFLYHGTPEKNKEIILKTGLKRMERHHVHLSSDIETARNVGGRRSNKVIVFKIDCKSMENDGIIFLRSQNFVWFTDFVDPKYLSIQEITGE